MLPVVASPYDYRRKPRRASVTAITQHLSRSIVGALARVLMLECIRELIELRRGEAELAAALPHCVTALSTLPGVSLGRVIRSRK